MSELCHTPGSGLRHTISFKPLTNPMKRNEHYRHLLMREVEGREELSLFFFFGELSLLNEDYSSNGSLTSNSLAACEVNGYHLTLKSCAFHTRQDCEASFLRKLPSFCPWAIRPYTSSHSLPHRSFTHEKFYIFPLINPSSPPSIHFSVPHIITVCGTMERFYSLFLTSKAICKNISRT